MIRENKENQAVATAESTPIIIPAVIRITPASRWWVVPVSELWNYRGLIYFFVWRDIKVRYKQTAVGAAWAVVQPFLTMLVFSLFFGRLAHIPSEGLAYPIFYYSALLPWMYFAASLQNATNTIVENQRVITKVYFPRLVLPLFGHAIRIGGFWCFFSDVCRNDGLLRNSADDGNLFFAVISSCSATDGARSGPLALCAQCALPGCEVCTPVPGAVLDVCLTRCLSEFADSGQVALGIWAEPDGWRD